MHLVKDPHRYYASLQAITRGVRADFPVNDNAPAGPLQGIADYAFDRTREQCIALCVCNNT